MLVGPVILLILYIGLAIASEVTKPNPACLRIHKVTYQPPASLNSAQDYFEQGNYDYDLGDCNAAIVDYSKAIELNPNFAEAYNNRAYTYMMRLEYGEALPDLNRAIEIRPNYAHALMNRGDIYNYDFQVDRQKALADYNRVIAQGPEAYGDTSVCGHSVLARNNGWHLKTIFDIFVNLRFLNNTC